MRRTIQVLIVLITLLSCGGMFSVFLVKVREAADRAQCTNNLKQLALAIENYHSTNNKLPKAAMPNPDLPREKRLSWIVAIFPYLEASPVYNKMDRKKGWDAEENRFAALLYPKTLHCAALPDPPSDTPKPTYYVGLTGVGSKAAHLPLEDARAGIFGYERILKREDLEDRAGSILMLAETSQVRGAWTAAGPPTTRGLIPDGSPYTGVGGQLGGNHRRGTNVAFADGSVRFLEQSIDPTVWEAMATVSGKGNQE